MSDVVIRAEGVGKQFRLGGAQPKYRTLRDSMGEIVTAPFRRLKAVFQGRSTDAGSEVFWALRNVSFEVKRGEVVGILGRNGAGKSTLLKLLARITPPTTGRITLDGKVGSLLEVGTGFHPELTGRDNVYLNAAILGMPRKQIDRKFDEIVQFAEIEQFIDTPVKHYSSGMYARLAFAVAAHMEPDVLVVDEVLAVGDVAFQKRCLGKMNDVARGGRTVLFVSHNMQAVRALCQRCLLLLKGQVALDDRTSSVVAKYQEQALDPKIGDTTAISDARLRRGSGQARFTEVAVEDSSSRAKFEFGMGEDVRVKCRYEVFSPISSLYFYLIVGNAQGDVTSIMQPLAECPVPAGRTGQCLIELPAVPLRPDEYTLKFYLMDDMMHPYDTLDGMVGPLIVSTNGSVQELGFNPASPNGAVSIPSRLLWSA